MNNLSENRKLYLRGTIILVVISLISFIGLNLLPIAYSFRLLEVFGFIILTILIIIGIWPTVLNENQTKN